LQYVAKTLFLVILSLAFIRKSSPRVHVMSRLFVPNIHGGQSKPIVKVRRPGDFKRTSHKALTTRRVAISVAALVACLVITSAVAAGIFFALNSPNVATSQSSSSSQGTTSSSSTSSTGVVQTSTTYSTASSSLSVNSTTTTITYTVTTTTITNGSANFTAPAPDPATLQCDAQIPSGLNLGAGVAEESAAQTKLRLITITPGSTAVLCVDWGLSPGQSSRMINFTGTGGVVSITAEPYGNASCSCSGTVYSTSAASGVTVLADPSSLTVPSYGGLLETEYIIRTTAQSTGFYDIEFPGQCPAFLPLAIVSPGQSITASDFPGFFNPSGCIAGPSGLGTGTIIGVSGMTVSWIQG